MCDADEYTLYIQDLPAELNKNGINRIFSQFGNVKSIIAPEDVKFAFITYSTYGEAEAAINGLDNAPPLNLKVSFRKQKGQDVVNNSSKIDQQLQSPEIRVQQDFRYSHPTILKINPSMKYQHLAQTKLPPRKLSPYHYDMDPNGYVPNPYPSYNPYDNIDYASTNAMWSRGYLSVDANGRRHVSMGRGHTSYHIPNPYPAIEKYIGKVYECRNSNCYTYGVDELQSNIGKCMLCLREAILMCSSCQGYYCSRECQVADWPKHKIMCSKIPILTHASNDTNKTISSQINSSELMNSSSRSRNNNELVQENTTRPIPPRNIDRSQSMQIEPCSQPQNIQRSKSYDSNNRKNTIYNNQNIVQFRMREPSQTTLKNSKIDLASRLQNIRIENSKATSDDFMFKRSTFLPQNDFTEVRIVVVLQPGLYGVQKNSDMNKLREIMTKLHKTADELPIASDIILGKIYAALYDGIWHRALILSKNPLKIDYIDYCTIEEMENMEFREIGELARIPRLSRVIKLSPSAMHKFKNLTEESIINVKMINVNSDDTINVEVLDQNEQIISNTKELCQSTSNTEVLLESQTSKIILESKVIPSFQDDKKSLPSIIDSMDIRMEVVADIAEIIDDYTVTATVIFLAAERSFSKLLDPLKQDCDAAVQKYKYFCPKLNDLVCAKKSDDYWVRGRVTEVSPVIKIASLDEGVIIEVEETIPILPEYTEIYTFAVEITSACKFSRKIDGGILKITGKEIINGETIIKGELTNPVFKNLKVDLKNWFGSNEIKEKRKPTLINLEIKNKSQVLIESYRDTSIMFLRSLEEKDVERYCRLIQDVAKSAQIAENLLSLPSPGDILLAKYIDGNYYRAIVLALDNNAIKIDYIDYGNNEVTQLDKLKVIPQSLIEHPRTSTRVHLKGIQKIPPTKEAMDYLGLMVEKEIPLICTFDGTIDDGVTLTTATGESVNDFINDLLTPSYEKNNDVDENEEEGGHFELGEMERGVLGNIGDTIDACFLDTFESDFKCVFAPLDNELISHISQVLPTLLKKYCESSDKYIPRTNELCIAQYEGDWYRGCCIKPSLTPSSSEIYFLDFGNISGVNHNDIRKMKRDFLKPAALGCVCTVPGLTSSKNQSQLQSRLDALLVANENYKIKILNYNNLEWTIEIPEIQKRLVQEELL